jgi:glutamate-1-semialdehyde 2,1-aminomutase
MSFRKFFDRSAKPAPSADPEAVEPEQDDGDETFDGEPEAPPEHADAVDWRARAAHVLPTGASTGSKRPAALYGSEDAVGPTHFSGAVGCRVFDIDGNEFIDCTMALGSVALGYAEPTVTRAVIEAASNGNVSGLSDSREVELAERLCEVVPCAEMVQFLKTGAEATSAAVRLARTYTGRDVVIGCGYFGWHDWSSTAPGVPAGTTASYRTVPFDDIPALEAAVAAAGTQLAAIIIEPVIERMPLPHWATRARELCDAAGAALIFDEIKTGFRLATGGYQEHSKITPDLAAFGKAMANGYPLSAVVGKRALMEAARNTWISSTLASESTALAAAGAVLDWHEKADICDSLASIGLELRESMNAVIKASGVAGVTIDGIDHMWLFRFDTPTRQQRFLELAAGQGVLFKRGAYNFPAIAHHDDIIQRIEAAANAAFIDLREEDASS